ncbi:MAG TPA: FixH family protein [Burkholderiaceae bacterium]
MELQHTAGRWYAHRWPWILMLGPALVLIAGFYTGYLAYTHPDALVAGDYYKKGKAINQDLRRERAAAALNLRLTLRFDAGAGALRGQLSGRAARGPLILKLVHATQPDKDVLLHVTPDEDGMFETRMPALARSRWQVMLEDEARTWRLGGAWHWPQEREVVFAAR